MSDVKEALGRDVLNAFSIKAFSSAASRRSASRRSQAATMEEPPLLLPAVGSDPNAQLVWDAGAATAPGRRERAKCSSSGVRLSKVGLRGAAGPGPAHADCVVRDADVDQAEWAIQVKPRKAVPYGQVREVLLSEIFQTTQILPVVYG